VNGELLNLGKKVSAISRPYLEEAGKSLKISIRISSFLVEAATRDSPNTSTENNGRTSVTVRFVSYTERVTNICVAAKASNFEAMCVFYRVKCLLSQWDPRPVPRESVDIFL